ncbi:MAG: hypothetical protein MJZ82_01410 [Paludibacteraceae bacterium]|nr:hypothetical protein [Paludibacteraceae bacterium]
MERLGLIGKPSDWLIASVVKRELLSERMHIQLVDIPIESITQMGEVDFGIAGADAIYKRVRELVDEYKLAGVTLRCFDLLSSVKNTGCIALSRLNDEGIPAACEGDVPTLLTMMLCKRLSGCPGFQVNPARIEKSETNGKVKLLLAHCTIPTKMCTSFSLTTHYESGIGVAIHGELPIGDYTLVKLSGNLDRIFAEDVELVANQYESNLCRTQVWIEGNNGIRDYLLTKPIANHHVLLPGHYASELKHLFETQIFPDEKIEN